MISYAAVVVCCYTVIVMWLAAMTSSTSISGDDLNVTLTASGPLNDRIYEHDEFRLEFEVLFEPDSRNRSSASLEFRLQLPAETLVADWMNVTADALNITTSPGLYVEHVAPVVGTFAGGLTFLLGELSITGNQTAPPRLTFAVTGSIGGGGAYVTSANLTFTCTVWMNSLVTEAAASATLVLSGPLLKLDIQVGACGASSC